MDKGTRVHITGGRQGKGQTGTIFWKGPNKYGEGDRYGVQGDDGATYWVVEDDVEKADGAAPPPPADTGVTFDKGDRVELQQNGQTVYGNVFWIGKSKMGGQRLGVRGDDSEEAIWIDARFVTAASGDAPPAPTGGAAPGGHAMSHGSDAEDDEMPASYAAPIDMGEMPPMAPIDDSDAARWAAEVDEEV